MASSRLNRRQLMFGGPLGLALAGMERLTSAQETNPRRGGVPRVALPRLPERIVDATLGDAWEASWAQSLMYDTPLRAFGTGQIGPGVGIGYHLDPDGRRADIPARAGVAFANGAALTAREIAGSIERAIETQSSAEDWRWELVERVEVIGDDRVRIHLSEPDATLPATLASSLVPVMPEGAGQSPFEFSSLPPGTGPFVPSAEADNVLRFIANRLYRVVGQPRFDGCSVIAVGQTIERTSRLVTGLVDIVPDVPSLDIPLMESDPRITLYGGVSRCQCAMVMQMDREPLNDVRVRRLIASVINRESLVEGATAGTGVPSNTLFPPTHWAGVSDMEIAQPAAASEVRDQLAELGLLPGWPLRLVCPESSPALANASVLLQEQLAAAGIAVSIDLLDDTAMEETRSAGDFGLMMTLLPLWNDPHEVAHPWLHAEGARNHGGFASARVDRLLALVRATTGEARRGELYVDIQRIVTEQVPLLPLFATPWFDGVKTRIAGYSTQPPPSARGIASAWFTLP